MKPEGSKWVWKAGLNLKLKLKIMEDWHWPDSTIPTSLIDHKSSVFLHPRSE